MLERQSQLRVLIVDDEEPARLRLVDLLRADADVMTILEATNGREALAVLNTASPDLMLLDVQMPGMSGLGLIEELGPDEMPPTIFVTAFDQHAIRAFEAHALDYVLKPFSDERLQAALKRAKERLDDLHLRLFRTQLAQTLANVTDRRSYLDRLAIRVDGLVQLLPVNKIECIEAAGVYVSVHSGDKQWLHREALSTLATKLDPQQFVRVHRSAIVNIASVLQLEPISHGEYEILLKSGKHLRVSRTYRSALERRLGQAL